MSVVEASGCHQARLVCPQSDVTRLLGTHAHGLLDPEWLARSNRSHRDLVVEVVRRTDRHSLNRGVLDHLLVVRDSALEAELVESCLLV